MSAQYYCYQCSNQTQVDFPAFVCRRCGGGFIQEMPPDPTPPPRDPVPVSDPATSVAGPSGGAAPNLTPFRTHGIPTAIASSTSSQQQQQTQPPIGQPVYIAGQPVRSQTRVSGQQAPQQPAANLVRGQVTITAVPFDANGMPLGGGGDLPMRYVHPQQMSMQQPQQPSAYGPYMQQVYMQPNPYVAHMQHPANAGQQRPPFNAFFPASQYPGVQPQQQQHHHHHVHPNNPQQNPGGVFYMGNGMPAGQQNAQMNVQPQMYAAATGNENMSNLMQMLTANIDDVLTAVLNQLGTQGGPPPITQEDVDRIASSPATKEMTGDKCSICLENFAVGVAFKEMPCTHQFHVPCIDRWLLLHGNCPICRTHLNGAAADTEDDNNTMHEVNVTYHIGPMGEVHAHGNAGPVQPQQQQRYPGPHVQQMFYRPAGQPIMGMRSPGPQTPLMGRMPAPNPAAHRTFIFSPPGYGQQQPGLRPQVPQQQQFAMFPGQNYAQPPAQRMPFVSPNGGGGQIYMNNGAAAPAQYSPSSGMLVMDIQLPDGYSGASQAPSTAQAPQSRQTATRSTRPRAPLAAGGSGVQQQPAPPTPNSVFGNLINTMTQAVFRPAGPASASGHNSSSSSISSTGAVAGSTPTSPAASTTGATDSSSATHPAPNNLQDDLGFD